MCLNTNRKRLYDHFLKGLLRDLSSWQLYLWIWNNSKLPTETDFFNSIFPFLHFSASPCVLVSNQACLAGIKMVIFGFVKFTNSLASRPMKVRQLGSGLGKSGIGIVRFWYKFDFCFRNKFDSCSTWKPTILKQFWLRWNRQNLKSNNKNVISTKLSHLTVTKCRL